MVKYNIKDIEKEIIKILKKIDKSYEKNTKIDIDSLSFVRFVMEIEKKYSFKFTPAEMFDEKFNQVSHIANIVKSK